MKLKRSNKPLNLRKSRRSIEEITVRSVRMEHIAEVRAQVGSERRVLRDERIALEAENRNTILSPAVSAGYHLLNILIYSIVVGLTVVDIPIQFVTLATNFDAISPWIWLAVAVAMALGISRITEGAAFAATYGVDPTRPPRAARICFALAGVTGALMAIALSVIFMSRSPVEALMDVLAGLFQTSVWIVAETAPLTAGFLAAALDARRIPELQQQRQTEIDLRLDALARFEKWLEEELRAGETNQSVPAAAAPVPVADQPTNSTPAEPVGSNGTAHSGQGTVLPLLLVLALLSSTASAMAADVAQREGERPSTSAAAHRRTRCTLWIDSTSSPNKDLLTKAAEVMLGSLPSFLVAFDCDPSEFAVGSFADEGPFSPLTRVPLPERAARRSCDGELPVLHGPSQLLLRNENYRQHLVSKSRQACEAENAAAERNAAVAADQFAKAVREKLLAGLNERGACTAVHALVAHRLAGNAPAVDVFITDGGETCAAVAPVPPSRGLVVLLLVPAKGDMKSTVPALMARAEEWKRLVPGLRVQFPNDITVTSWAQLAAEIGAVVAPVDSK